MNRACSQCLTRARVIEALAPRINVMVGRRPVRQLLALSTTRLLEATGVPDGQQQRILDQAAAAAERDAVAEIDGAAICIHDDRYPHQLRELPDPPHALFHTGPLERLEGLLGERPVAIVGSRRPSAQAEQNATELGRKIGVTGLTVVSGLAFGIDAACHRGALTVSGGAIAVLAAGADRPSPVRNRALYREVRAVGTVLSEMPWGATPWRWGFPARNRIMAALAEMTIVVEATERSGSLITAQFALQLGRQVGAMPGASGARLTQGSNLLIRDGCAPIQSATDALDAVLGVELRQELEAGSARRRIGGDPVLGALLDSIEVGETMDEMSARSGLPARELRAALARLEQIGLIRRSGLRGYVATTTV